MKNAVLVELLSHVVKTPAVTAEKLENYFGSYTAIAEAEPDEIARALGGDMSCAIYIKLAVSLVSRRFCDKLTVGKKHTAEKIENYLLAYFYGMSVETVAVISFDSSGKLISVDKASEGTVNFSAVMPRKILEIAKRRHASGVIIAHNHPGGYPFPSDDDKASSKLLSELLLLSGIEVKANYIVAGSKCTRICAE